MNLGNKIANKRKALGLTQEQLAEQLHVTRQTLSKWESNLSKPDIDSLKTLASIFGCSVESLLDENKDALTESDKPTQTPVKYPHVFGILSIVLGALGLIPGLIFAIIGKKNSTNPHDKKLNSVGVGISIGGLVVWTIVCSIGGYFLGQQLAKQLTSSNFSYTSYTLPEDACRVYFDNYDGTLISSTTVKKGEKVSHVPANPTRSSDISGSYTFKEWQPSLATIINGDTTFTATYDRTPAQYTARFVNWDRSLLEEKTYAYGSLPAYTGPVPTPPTIASGTYTFSGWDPSLAYGITQDTTYTAQYNYTVYTFRVRFLQYDGSVLQTFEVPYDNVASGYNEPTREPTLAVVYTFKGWDKDPATTKIYANTDFTATYSESPRSYSVKFLNYDGSELQNSSVVYQSTATYSGAAPTRPSDDLIYTFKGWDKDPASTPIAADTSFIAQYDSVSNSSAFTFTLLQDGTYSVAAASYPYSYENLRLPDSYNGAYISTIASNGFHDAASLKQLVLPSHLTTISDSAFASCYLLEDFTLPSTLTSIGTSAFSWCSALTSLTCPASLKSIGELAFFQASKLSALTLNDGLTSLGAKCFDGCDILNLSIPEGLTVIPENAFLDNRFMTKLTLPSTLTSIGNGAFAGLTSLTQVSVPEGVTSLGSSVFSGDSALSSITLPSTLTSIDFQAFNECSFTSISLPSGLKSLGGGAFMSCKKLTSLRLPGSLTSLGTDLVSDCSSLTSVYFEEGITSLPAKVIECGESTCPKLASIYLPSTLTSVAADAFPKASSSDTLSVHLYLNMSAAPASWSSWYGSNCTLYLYAENQPSTAGHFWHYVGGVITDW